MTPENQAYRPGGSHLFSLLSLAGLIAAVIIISLVYLKLSLPAAEQMRQEQLDSLLEERAGRLNGLLAERTRFALSLASLGEDFYLLRHSSLLNQLSAEQWENIIGESLKRQYQTFPEIVGGGIWYEPNVFDPDYHYRGFYVQWVPPVGTERELEFTMEWSNPEADYHNQEWYRALIPVDHPAHLPLKSNTVWTSPYIDPVTEVLMITVDAAMYSPDGQLIGMSTVDWNLNQIGELVETTQPTERSQAFLMDPVSGKFIAVANNPDLTLMPVEQAQWGEIFFSQTNRKISHSYLIGKDHEGFWIYSIPLTNGLQFGFRIPHEDIFGPVRKSTFITLALILLTLSLLFITFAYFSRKIMGESLRYLAEARDEAVRVSKIKDQFLTNMSHEIRTPMNGILGMLELELEDRGASNPSTKLTLAHQSAKNLLRIINDILDFSKLEVGKLELIEKPYSPKNLIESLTATYETLASSRDITIVCAFDSDLPEYTKGDSGRVSQIIVNLVGNALKFSDNHGGVLVYAEKVNSSENGDLIKISVTDSGMGIAQEQLSSVFEAFTQIDGSATRHIGGTGLGLSIARSLAEEMGGELTVRSKKGVGSAFSLALPYAPTAAESLEEISEKLVIPETQNLNLNILVAEDNRINQKLIQRLLQKAGCSVRIAGDGKEALNILGEQQFDLILMDIQMPELDGFGALEQIRSGSHGFAGIPIVALTAHAMQEYRDQALNAGFNDYLTKPINRAELYTLLEKYSLGTQDTAP